MENFVVSARKYRPSTFASVIGQSHITQTLKNAIRTQQLAHAFLFCGPRGVGKTTCARILAKTINCHSITDDFEACNNCDSCNAFNASSSFNIYELDAASNNSVDDIRALVEQVRYPPQNADYKIYIIDEVHMLSAAAFNAFLKTLEEPPSYAKFILATTEKHKILPTILSRCQVFDFHRIGIQQAVEQLNIIVAKEGIEAEEEALHTIALKADGAMRDALSIFDRIVSFSGKKITYKDVIDNLNILDYEYYFKAVEAIMAKDIPSMLLLFDKVLTNGFDTQHFLSGFSEHIRNLMMCKHANTVKLLEVSRSVGEKYIQQAQNASPTLLLNALNLLNRCELDFKMSKNQRLHVELTLMKLCHIQSAVDLYAVANEEKKKAPDVTAKPIISEAKPASETVAPLPAAKPESTAIDTAPVKKTLPGFGKSSNIASLDKIRQRVENNAQQKQEPIAVNTTTEALLNEPVTLEKFKQAFDEYVNHLANHNKKNMAVIYQNIPYKLLDENNIEFEFDNKLESELFDADRQNMLPQLRKHLRNSLFDIVFVINASAESNSRIPFTSEEKFKLMQEKNPNLIELRNIFGLEIE
jgi:DNA polymerase-3 subunit gamma/tau